MKKISLAIFLALLVALPSDARADRKLLVRVDEDKGRQGVCKKLVMTPRRGEEAIIYETPGGGAEKKVPAYSFKWLIKEDDGETIGSGDFFRVGGPSGTPLGYVKKDSVTAWDTLFCIEPFIGAADKVFRVNLPGGNVAEYVSTTSSDVVRCFVLSADVDDKSVDAEDTLYDVLLYAGEAVSAQTSAEEQVALKELDTTETPLEIVFVIDTTASMEPLLKVATTVAKAAASQLTSGDRETRNANVSFGLVEYRDAKGGCAFDTKVACKLTKNYNTFVSAVDGLQPSDVGSGDFAEAVGKGLETALNPSSMGWSKLGNRHIVLLGDAPNKEESGPKMDAVATMCKAHGKTDGVATLMDIYVQAIVNGDDGDAIRQFSNMVTSTNPSGGGFYKNIESGDVSHPDVKMVSQQLVDFLHAAIQVNSAKGAGDVQKVKKLVEQNADNAIVQRTWAIMSKNGDPATTPELFHNGSATIVNASGKKVGQRKVLVLKNTLKRLGPTLAAFAANLSAEDIDSIEDPNFILELLQGALAKPISGDVQTLKGLALKDIIANDLPIQTPSLQLTPEKLSKMTNDDFHKWIAEVNDAATVAKTLHDEAEWFDGGGEKYYYAFIAIKDLP